MYSQKLRGAIGFAMRSGNCASGEFACQKAIKAGKAMLVLVDSSASEATRQRYMQTCSRAGLACLVVDELGAAIGKPERVVAAITESGFARRIEEAFAKIDGGVC